MKKEDGFQQIEQNYNFEQKERKWRKVFYWVFSLFIIAGLLGFFGNGLISSNNLEQEDFSLKYQRFARTQTPTKLEIISRASTSPFSFGINKKYLEKAEVKNVVPQPDSVEVTQEELIYHFNTNPGGVISIYLEPQGFGSRDLEIGVQGRKTSLNQFVYF